MIRIGKSRVFGADPNAKLRGILKHANGSRIFIFTTNKPWHGQWMYHPSRDSCSLGSALLRDKEQAKEFIEAKKRLGFTYQKRLKKKT